MIDTRQHNGVEIVQVLTDMLSKNRTAYHMLGEVYLLGLGGMQPNFQRAMELFNQGANLGDARSQFNRGFMYANGIGVPQAMDKAVLNFYFAAIGGDALAQMTLGYYHMHGYNVPKSCTTAVRYYDVVAKNVVKELQQDSSPVRVIERIRLSNEQLNEQSPDEDEDVIQYYEHSAANGDVGAQLALGKLYFYGAHGLVQDLERAAHYLQAAANRGEVRAMATLGRMYANGMGVEKNYERALEYFKSASMKGNADAYNGLGGLYKHGRGVKVDAKRAVEYFKKAADRNNADAQYNLGLLYQEGDGVEKNHQTALQYFAMASQHGHTLAVFKLAQMHYNGIGTVATCATAVKLLKTVAERTEWAVGLSQAHRYYLQGEHETAMMMYVRLSLVGLEVAQGNAAFLLGPMNSFEFQSMDKQTRARLAYHHYRESAAQGNVHAQRVIGDYHYYGLMDKVNYEEAAQQYLVASDKHDAQSLFNMGYMHEYGIGVPQDFHLAKRYFDQALSIESKALVPVRLALLNLWWHRKMEEDWNTAAFKVPDWRSIASSLSWTSDMEDALLYLLCALLAIVVYVRGR